MLLTLFWAMQLTGRLWMSSRVQTHWPTFMSYTSSDLFEPAMRVMSVVMVRIS